MPKQPLPDFDLLVKMFDGTGVNAIVLMGSHARGAAGVFSDIDLVRFMDQQAASQPAAGDGSYLSMILWSLSEVSPLPKSKRGFPVPKSL